MAHWRFEGVCCRCSYLQLVALWGGSGTTLNTSSMQWIRGGPEVCPGNMGKIEPFINSAYALLHVLSLYLSVCPKNQDFRKSPHYTVTQIDLNEAPDLLSQIEGPFLSSRLTQTLHY